MEENNRLAVNQVLKTYKTLEGSPNFPALFSIPTSERLPALAKEDIERCAALVGAGINVAMESMNLVRPMNATQIMDLTDAVIETSEEDNLSLEDLMLFLQKLVRGEYGAMYESMDIPKFMEKFEAYRDQRHRSMLRMREEQNAQYRALPINDRMQDMFPDDERKKHAQAMIQHMINTAKPNSNE